jgi:glycosyltransferase involved in cell wall biosynthesis
MSSRSQFPKVSVVTATFNSEPGLRRTIENMRKLQYTNFEYIVIDGNSKDQTKALLAKSGDIVTKWVSEPDNGIYDAWNKGVRLATGEWISFLGAGDYYLPNALNNYFKHLSTQTEAIEFCSSKIQMINWHEQVKQVVGTPWDWPTLKKCMKVAQPGSLHHRSLFERIGLFDTNLRIVGDYEFLLRAGPQLKSSFIDAITANMAIGGVGSSTEAQRETMQVKIKLGHRNPLFCQLDYLEAAAKAKVKTLLYRP